MDYSSKMTIRPFETRVQITYTSGHWTYFFVYLRVIEHLLCFDPLYRFTSYYLVIGATRGIFYLIIYRWVLSRLCWIIIIHTMTKLLKYTIMKRFLLIYYINKYFLGHVRKWYNPLSLYLITQSAEPDGIVLWCPTHRVHFLILWV